MDGRAGALMGLPLPPILGCSSRASARSAPTPALLPLPPPLCRALVVGRGAAYVICSLRAPVWLDSGRPRALPGEEERFRQFVSGQALLASLRLPGRFGFVYLGIQQEADDLHCGPYAAWAACQVQALAVRGALPAGAAALAAALVQEAQAQGVGTSRWRRLASVSCHRTLVSAAWGRAGGVGPDGLAAMCDSDAQRHVEMGGAQVGSSGGGIWAGPGLIPILRVDFSAPPRRLHNLRRSTLMAPRGSSWRKPRRTRPPLPPTTRAPW